MKWTHFLSFTCTCNVSFSFYKAVSFVEVIHTLYTTWDVYDLKKILLSRPDTSLWKYLIYHLGMPFISERDGEKVPSLLEGSIFVEDKSFLPTPGDWRGFLSSFTEEGSLLPRFTFWRFPRLAYHSKVYSWSPISLPLIPATQAESGIHKP